MAYTVWKVICHRLEWPRGYLLDPTVASCNTSTHVKSYNITLHGHTKVSVLRVLRNLSHQAIRESQQL